jgi:ankyrin repeat protein
MRGERRDAQRRLNHDPGLLARLGPDERAALVRAAERGNTAAVMLMLDLGFPLETRGDDGGTALHAASYNGSPQTVRLLLDQGADIEARDTTWNDTPLGWAAVGSGERPRTNTATDWIETARTLLEHGASTKEISLDPDSPKPPSPEVAELLQAHIDRLPPR